MNIQLLNGASGKPEFAVVPIDEFNRLAAGKMEISDDGEIWESIPVDDEVLEGVYYPHEVVSIMAAQDVSLMAAWRIYRGISQTKAASEAGISQAALSQMEKVGSKPHEKTRLIFAKIYDCLPEQLLG